MGDIYTVVVDSLLVRSQPNTNGARIKALYKGNTVEVDQVSGNWVHHNNGPGWSCATASGGKSYMVRTSIPEPEESPSPPATNSTEQSVQIQEENLREYQEEDLSSSGYEPDWSPYNLTSVSTTEDYLNDIEDSLNISSCRGIHGMPYQFMPIADTRISSAHDAFGRKYAEKIVARMPILCLTPGKPIFLEGYNNATKGRILDKFIRYATNQDSVNKLDELIGGAGKFYSIQFEYKRYYNYVNTMCRQAAMLLGIGDKEINGRKLSNFDWGGDTKSDLSKIINYTDCVAFYIDSEKSISESFSNDTTDSSLKGQMSSLSDMGRELQYLMGNVGGDIGGAFDKFTGQENLTQNIENVNDFIENVLGKGNGNIFKRITGNIQTVVSGGRLIFPEIWSDSSFGRSFNISQTLVSPDPDDLSIYLNILVPMFHWIGLTAPRAALSNGYTAPYILRGFYKGMFNVDMGIITGLNFTKGDEGSWNRSGLPTMVKVSVDIKDLYSSFSISDASGGDVNIFNNTILMDYIANLCGVNINEPDIYRNIEMYLSTQSNRIVDQLRFDIFRGLEQSWTNAAHKIYRNIFF